MLHNSLVLQYSQDTTKCRHKNSSLQAYHCTRHCTLGSRLHFQGFLCTLAVFLVLHILPPTRPCPFKNTISDHKMSLSDEEWCRENAKKSPIDERRSAQLRADMARIVYSQGQVMISFRLTDAEIRYWAQKGLKLELNSFYQPTSWTSSVQYDYEFTL